MIKITAHKAEVTVTFTTFIDVTYGILLALLEKGFTDFEIVKIS